MSRRKPSAAELKLQVDRWNARVSIGQDVDYRSYVGAPPVRFKTRTAAQILSGHTAVVWLEGKVGCVAIEFCTAVRS